MHVCNLQMHICRLKMRICRLKMELAAGNVYFSGRDGLFFRPWAAGLRDISI